MLTHACSCSCRRLSTRRCFPPPPSADGLTRPVTGSDRNVRNDQPKPSSIDRYAGRV